MNVSLESEKLFKDIEEYVSKIYKHIRFVVNTDYSNDNLFVCDIFIDDLNISISRSINSEYIKGNDKFDYITGIIDVLIKDTICEYFTTGNTYNSFERCYNYEV